MDTYGISWTLTGRPARQFQIGDTVFIAGRKHQVDKIDNRRGFRVTMDTGKVIDADHDVIKTQQGERPVEYTIHRPRAKARV